MVWKGSRGHHIGEEIGNHYKPSLSHIHGVTLP